MDILQLKQLIDYIGFVYTIMNTNAFYSPEDVIALAKEVCKARFLGYWKLKIVDYSGKDLDSEILISEL